MDDFRTTILIVLLIGPIIFIIIVIMAIRMMVRYFGREGYSQLEEWAHSKELIFYSENRKAIQNRFSASPNKKFCWASSLLNFPFFFYSGPYIEGKFQDRKVWIYKINGREVYFDKNSRFRGWCLELSTHKIPVSLLVTRRKFGKPDEVDTESREFEKQYNIDVYSGEEIRQLLDPAMMSIIIDSQVSIMEFSDSSVVMYYLSFPPSKEILDYAIDIGLRIAHQVDHNFPID